MLLNILQQSSKMNPKKKALDLITRRLLVALE